MGLHHLTSGYRNERLPPSRPAAAPVTHGARKPKGWSGSREVGCVASRERNGWRRVGNLCTLSDMGSLHAGNEFEVDGGLGSNGQGFGV